MLHKTAKNKRNEMKDKIYMKVVHSQAESPTSCSRVRRHNSFIDFVCRSTSFKCPSFVLSSVTCL